jgi:hypothetical protein
MLERSSNDLWDEDSDAGGDELAVLHQAYVTSIRQHRRLMGDLCATLERIADALKGAGIDGEARSLIADGIEGHVDRARAIVAGIDKALTLAALTRPIGRQ